MNINVLKFFLYSFSWGYRKVFDQYAQLLHERFPALDIQGDNYPPPSGRAAVAQFLSIFKLFVIVMIVSGQNPFPHLNMETPSLFNWATENKVLNKYYIHIKIYNKSVKSLEFIYIYVNFLMINFLGFFPQSLSHCKIYNILNYILFCVLLESFWFLKMTKIKIMVYIGNFISFEGQLCTVPIKIYLILLCRFMHVSWCFSSVMPLKGKWFQLVPLRSLLMVMTPNNCTFLYYTGIRNYIMIYINDEY